MRTEYTPYSGHGLRVAHGTKTLVPPIGNTLSSLNLSIHLDVESYVQNVDVLSHFAAKHIKLSTVDRSVLACRFVDCRLKHRLFSASLDTAADPCIVHVRMPRYFRTSWNAESSSNAHVNVLTECGIYDGTRQ